MEGEPHRGRRRRRTRRDIGCKILLCNPPPLFFFPVAGVLHLLKMEEKNSSAISTPCPEGSGLPQSHRSVLLSLCMRVAKQMM